MNPKPGNLIWIDLEMTGLDTQRDRIIEIATIITDGKLNILAEGPVFAIYQPDEILEEMDDWNTRQHTGSKLLNRVRESNISEMKAETATIEFLLEYVQPGKSPMCGNTICQDRRFLHRCMPKLEQFFHYRNLDVSTIKELAMRWAPDLVKAIKKESRHLALDDIRDSIHELRYYRDHFFKLPHNF
jgi:oligoribonuclease